METRTVTQTKIYLLCLNPIVREIDANSVLCWSYSKDAMINYYNTLRTTPYQDMAPDPLGEGFKPVVKHFIKGSPLEMYNPITDFDRLNTYGNGICSNWVLPREIETMPSYVLHIAES